MTLTLWSFCEAVGALVTTRHDAEVVADKLLPLDCDPESMEILVAWDGSDRRLVFVPEALAYEPVDAAGSAESGRQARVIDSRPSAADDRALELETV